jgi:hypothetical protein
MKILKNVVNVSISLTQASCSDFQLERSEYASGIIDWVLIFPRKEYKLEAGEWSIFNKHTFKYDTLNKTSSPTWEQDYQALILMQYPLEKRVREIVVKSDDISEVCFHLNRDFGFLSQVRKSLIKTP